MLGVFVKKVFLPQPQLFSLFTQFSLQAFIFLSETHDSLVAFGCSLIEFFKREAKTGIFFDEILIKVLDACYLMLVAV